MKNNFLLYHLLIVAFLVSCNKDEIIVPPLNTIESLSNFSFLRSKNAGITVDIYLEQDDHRFYGILPPEGKIRELKASFDLREGSVASVNGVIQENGITINDFSDPVHYLVTNSDNTEEVYVVYLEFDANLPILYIQTEGGAGIYSKDEYINAVISVDGGDEFDDLEGNIKIRGRGNSTWGIHPKKPYQIKFEDKTKMLGLPKDKRWLLLAEYSDKTFLRNKIAFKLGYLSDLDWTPECEYANVYLNGEFQGLYLICQKVEESSNRVNITNDGFLLEIDQLERIDADDVYFYSDHFLLNIKEPDLTESGPESEYIESYIDDFEKALFGDNFKDPVNGYKKYIEMESVVDWFLINEISKNVDAMWFASIFMYLAPGEKLKMGPIWDFDLAFGNVNYAASEFPEGWWVKENPWIKRMCEDPAFIALVKERYVHFRGHQGEIYEMMDNNVDYIYQSQVENDQKWQTIGMWVWPNSRVYDSYEDEVSYVKTWLGERLSWLDGAISSL